MKPSIKWFSEIGIDDLPLVGGKNASLGEMYRELTAKGVRVPDGFATTADAYRLFLASTGLDEKIHGLLRDLDTRDIENLRWRGSQIRQAILATELPAELAAEIVAAYNALSAGNLLHPAHVAVRSSATAETIDAMNDGTWWTAQQLAARLGITRESARRRLYRLSRSDVVEIRVGNGCTPTEYRPKETT